MRLPKIPGESKLPSASQVLQKRYEDFGRVDIT